MFTVPIGINTAASTIVFPPVTTGLINWLRPEGIQTSGTDVIGWTDSSGAGHHWTSPSTSKLQIIPSAYNSKSCVRGINYNDNSLIQYLSCSAFRSGSDDGEVMAVLKSNGPGAYGAPYSWQWSEFGNPPLGQFQGHYAYGFYPGGQTGIYDTFGSTSRDTFTAGTSVDTICVISFARDGYGQWCYQNGTLLSGSPGGSSRGWESTFYLFSTGPARVADYSTTYGYHVQWNGDLCELCFYDHKLSTTDRNTMVAYLKSAWGIT